MTHYVSRLLNIGDQLSDMGESPSESDKMFVLMSGLEHDNQYSSIVDSLQIQPDMTFQIASQHLINWYDKQKLSGNLKTEVKPQSVDKLHFNQQFKNVKVNNEPWRKRKFNKYSHPNNNNNNNNNDPKKVKVNKYCKFCNMNNHSTDETMLFHVYSTTIMFLFD